MNLILTILTIFSQSITEFCVAKNLAYNKNYTMKYSLLISFIVFLVQMFISNFWVPNHLRFIFSVIIFITVIFFLFKQRISNALVTGFICMIFISLIEVIITCLLFILGVTQNDLINNIYLKFALNIIISLSSILLIYHSIIKNSIIKFRNIITKSKNLVNSCIIILAAIYLVIAKNALFAYSKLDMIINLSILFGTIVLFIIIFSSDNKNKILEETNKQMLNYVTKYERIITEQGKANHEFKNQLMVIRGYAQMKSPRLMEYLDSVVEDTKKAHSSYLISQLNKFPDGGIKGLLYYKLSLMDDEKIKYDINVETGVKTKLNSLNTVMYKNITKILGVLLDNAIDASKNAKEKKITISVSKEKSLVKFNIYNTYNGKIDIKKIGTGYTTKGSGHGYGLRLVKDIIEENKEFNVINKVENEYYVSSLSIKVYKKRKGN